MKHALVENKNSRHIQGAFLALAAILFCIPLQAYDFLYTHPETGKPIGWETSVIFYHLDPQPLGRFSNDEVHALFKKAVQVWRDAPGVRVPSFTFAGYLGVKMKKDAILSYLNPTPCLQHNLNGCLGRFQKQLRTVILFDPDGSILKTAVCPGGECLAGSFAGVFSGTAERPRAIVQGAAVFSSALDQKNKNRKEAAAFIFRVMVHEVGHLLGLGHSTLNQNLHAQKPLENARVLPVMFATGPDDDSPAVNHSLSTLRPDDEAGISVLYPEENLSTQTGGISGTVFQGSGAPLHHAHVVARDITDPIYRAYSAVSGKTCPENTTPSHALYGGECRQETGEIAATGDFEIQGLPPGIYSLQVEETSDAFARLDLSPASYASFPPNEVPDFENANDLFAPLRRQPFIEITAGQISSNVVIHWNDE